MELVSLPIAMFAEYSNFDIYWIILLFKPLSVGLNWASEFKIIEFKVSTE